MAHLGSLERGNNNKNKIHFYRVFSPWSKIALQRIKIIIYNIILKKIIVRYKPVKINACLLSFCLKVSTDCDFFIDCRRSFQSTPEAKTKERPTYAYVLRLNTGFIKRFLVVERRDLEGL